MSNAKVGRAVASQGDDGDILVGVESAGVAFTAFVLDHTIRRPLQAQSFFTEPGGRRHNAEAHRAMQERLNLECLELTEGLSGAWYAPKCAHNCLGTLLGNRCCVNSAVARQKLKVSLEKVSVHVLSSLRVLAANKWRSISNCRSKIGLGVLVHNVLGDAFARTLASGDELKRLRALVDADLLAADASSSVSFTILRGKRVLGSSAFLSRAETTFLVLSFLVASTPIGKLFATFFECEEFASSKGGRALGRGEVGLLQSLVSRTGILHQVHGLLAKPLFDHSDVSSLQLYRHVQSIAVHCSVDAGQGVRMARSFQLRLSASFRFRFMGSFGRSRWTCSTCSMPMRLEGRI